MFCKEIMQIGFLSFIWNNYFFVFSSYGSCEVGTLNDGIIIMCKRSEECMMGERRCLKGKTFARTTQKKLKAMEIMPDDETKNDCSDPLYLKKESAMLNVKKRRKRRKGR